MSLHAGWNYIPNEDSQISNILNDYQNEFKNIYLRCEVHNRLEKLATFERENGIITVCIDKRVEKLEYFIVEWIVLHELGHAYYNHRTVKFDGKTEYSVLKDELCADIWACYKQTRKQGCHYGVQALNELAQLTGKGLDGNCWDNLINENNELIPFSFRQRISQL